MDESGGVLKAVKHILIAIRPSAAILELLLGFLKTLVMDCVSDGQNFNVGFAHSLCHLKLFVCLHTQAHVY